MTIYLYSGTPGSGKSLHAASDIRAQLAMGRPVITNFELGANAKCRNREMYHYIPDLLMRPQDLRDFATDYWESVNPRFAEDRLLLVLDEMQVLHNSREWQRNGGGERLDWLTFFSQHRKYGYRVIMIAQNAKMIDNQYRMLIEHDIQHRKMSNYGMAGWLASLLFGGKLFAFIDFYYPTGDRLGMEWYVMRRRDAAMYDTRAIFQREA